jgi:hypothetical protein
MTPNTTITIVFAALTLFGFILGFARAIQLVARGPVGFALVIFACVVLGGIMQTWDMSKRLIADINEAAAGFISFLGYFAGYTAFYIILFIIILIVRAIILQSIKAIFDSKKKSVKFTNRTLGALLVFSFSLAVVFLYFAVIRAVDESSFAQGQLNKISDTFLMWLYEHNPIRFV